MNAEAASATHAMVPVAVRLGEAALRRRLALEAEQDTSHYRHVGDLLHPEHLPFAGRMLHCILVAAGLRARGRRNALDIQVRRNEVTLGQLPSAFDGFTLLHLSDLHADAGQRYLDALATAVRDVTCDACVLTGDYRFATQGSCVPTVAALARVVPLLPHPAFAVLGNHDDLAIAEGLEGLGVQVLMNERATLRRGEARLHIAGIDDAHYFRTHDISRAAERLVHDDCAILLSHTPETPSQGRPSMNARPASIGALHRSLRMAFRTMGALFAAASSSKRRTPRRNWSICSGTTHGGTHFVPLRCPDSCCQGLQLFGDNGEDIVDTDDADQLATCASHRNPPNLLAAHHRQHVEDGVLLAHGDHVFAHDVCDAEGLGIALERDHRRGEVAVGDHSQDNAFAR